MIYSKLLSNGSAAALLARVPDMMADAERAKLACVAPTAEQRAAVHAAALELAAVKGRKVYGAWALVQALSRVPGLSAEGADPADASGAPEVEFYSPDPLRDATDLCDHLFACGHRYVQAREGNAHRTYVISVEFARLVNITYVPPHVFAAIPTMPLAMPPAQPMSASGVDAAAAAAAAGFVFPPVVSPSFLIMDYLRVLCDPYTSYWRLDRALPRLVALQSAYPVGVPPRDGPPGVHAPDAAAAGVAALGPPADARVAAVLAWAAGRDSCVSVGEHARAYMFAAAVHCVAVADPAELLLPLPPLPVPPAIQQLTLVSVEYAADLVSLADTFGAGAPDARRGGRRDRQGAATITEHAELIGLLGRRATLRIGDRTVMTLIDAGGRAVPVCARSPDGLLVAGFSYCLLSSMAQRFLVGIRSRASAERFHASVIGDLLAYREAAGIVAASGVGGDTTVTNPESPFRDVALATVGWPKTDMRVHMEMTDRRRAEVGTPRATVWFTYDPSKPAARPFRYRMLRSDGEHLPPSETVLAAVYSARAAGGGGAAAEAAGAPAEPAPPVGQEGQGAPEAGTEPQDAPQQQTHDEEAAAYVDVEREHPDVMRLYRLQLDA